MRTNCFRCSQCGCIDWRKRIFNIQQGITSRRTKSWRAINKLVMEAMKLTYKMPETQWYVYVVRCKDGTLYTGITKDLRRRVAEHNSDNGGAKYTRSRKPVQLVYAESVESRSIASKREYQLKQMSVTQKQALIKTTVYKGSLFADLLEN